MSEERAHPLIVPVADACTGVAKAAPDIC